MVAVDRPDRGSLREPALQQKPTATRLVGLGRRPVRRKAAGFPTGKTFETWDESLSSIPAPTQQALQTLEWIGRKENVVVCGPSGTGKTFFLEALGQQVVEAGMRVAWFALEDRRPRRSDARPPRR